MRVWDVWVGFKGYSWNALVKSETEVGAITELMKVLDNKAEASPVEDSSTEPEIKEFRLSDETVVIYDCDQDL